MYFGDKDDKHLNLNGFLIFNFWQIIHRNIILHADLTYWSVIYARVVIEVCNIIHKNVKHLHFFLNTNINENFYLFSYILYILMFLY